MVDDEVPNFQPELPFAVTKTDYCKLRLRHDYQNEKNEITSEPALTSDQAEFRPLVASQDVTRHSIIVCVPVDFIDYISFSLRVGLGGHKLICLVL